MTYERIPEVVVPGRRLGRHRNHDPRSKAYRFRRTVGDPQTVTDWPTIPCLDQGDVGSCVGNAATELLASKRFVDVRPAVLDEPFAQGLYSDATRVDPYEGAWKPEDTGTDGNSVAKVLTARGLASGWQHVMDFASLNAALQVGGLLIGIKWRSGCDEPNSTGLIRYTGAVRGGHELYLAAYDRDRQRYGIQNHWGAEWGVGGRCWMTAADLAAALEDDGDATLVNPADIHTPPPDPTADPYAGLREPFDAWVETHTSTITVKSRAARQAWLDHRQETA